MPAVAYDEIPLTDERKLAAIFKRLGVPLLGPGMQPLARQPWERYLLDRRTHFVWHGKNEVWLTATCCTAMSRTESALPITTG